MNLNVISPTLAKLDKRFLRLFVAPSSSTGAVRPSNKTTSFLLYFCTNFFPRKVTVVKCGESIVGRTARISGLGLLMCMWSNAISRSFLHGSREYSSGGRSQRRSSREDKGQCPGHMQ